MVRYFVSARIDDTSLLHQFCSRNNLPVKWISAGWNNGTMMYSVLMTSKDATAMKLSMQVNIMETENG